MIAKYFATSLAMLNVVSAPRVISSCLPISTISISLVGLESRSTMLPASLAACVPVFMATATSACASAGRVVRAVAGHGHQPPARLILADQLELGFGRGLGQKVIDARFGGDRRGRQRIVAGDHHRLDAHPPQLGEALLDAAFDDVLEVNDAQRLRCPRRRPAACRPAWRCRSTSLRTSCGQLCRPARARTPRSRRPRLCGSAGRRD